MLIINVYYQLRGKKMKRLESLLAGIKTYDCQPCPSCGGTKRYVSNAQCPPCNTRRVRDSRNKKRKMMDDLLKSAQLNQTGDKNV